MFSGSDAGWPDWRFRFQVCCDLVDVGNVMRLAVMEQDPIPLACRLVPQCRTRARFLYGLLVQVCAGRALALLRIVPNNNGLEAWRVMCRESEPKVAARTAAMLSAILSPTWMSSRSFLEQLLEWERQIGQYETTTLKVVDDETRCAVVAR